jgi:hypothetical protein
MALVVAISEQDLPYTTRERLCADIVMWTFKAQLYYSPPPPSLSPLLPSSCLMFCLSSCARHCAQLFLLSRALVQKRRLNESDSSIFPSTPGVQDTSHCSTYPSSRLGSCWDQLPIPNTASHSTGDFAVSHCIIRHLVGLVSFALRHSPLAHIHVLQSQHENGRGNSRRRS